MAAVAGHRTKGTRASNLTGIGKENISPKKTKVQQKHRKTRDINGIFGYDHRTAEQHDPANRKRTAVSPKFAGISKPSATKPGFFARMRVREEEQERARVNAKKAESTPNVDALLDAQRKKQKAMSFGLADAIKPYIETTTNDWKTMMKESRKQQEALRHGVDHKTGKPLNRPGIPSKEDFTALARMLDDLDQPFENDEISLSFRSPDGSTTTKTVRVADIVDKCAKRCGKLQALKKELEQDVKTIDEEIEELRQEIADDAGAGKKADKEYEKQMKAFEKERKEIEAKAKAERAELKEDEKKKTGVLNKKIQELLALTTD